MLNIQNQVFVELKIDGSPLEYVVIKDLTLAEGNGAYAPTMKLEIDDPTSLLSKSRALSEGNTVEVLITRSQSDTESKPRKYRIFGPTRDNNSYNPNLVIIGLLDCPKYFTASAREAHTGTTDQVLQEVADICGLTYEGPDNGRTLNDRQIWLDVCASRARFVYEVTRHAYMDDQSCMESVVTSTHELVYRNIIDSINTSPEQIQYVFTHSTLDSSADGGKREFIVKEVRDRSTSGVMANWVNYGSTRCNNNIDGVQKNRKAVDVHAPGRYLAINQEVAEMVKRTRFDYAPIDCTNTHKEYQNAWYQNLKLLALFTETISLLVTDVTNIKLLDPLIYRQADADPSQKVRNEDKYIVVGKTIVVRGGIHYAERIQCARISLEMTGTATLKSSLDGMGDDSPLESYPPSVVPQASMDLGFIGSVISNIGSVTSISSSVMQVTNVLGGLQGITGMIPGALTSIVGPVGNVLDSVMSGGSFMDSALGSVLEPITSIAGQLSSLGNLTGAGQSAIQDLVSILAKQPSSVASTILTGSGSALPATSEALKLLALFGVLSNTTSSIASVIPNSLQNGTNATQLLTQSTQMLSMMQNTGQNAAGMWNSTLSGYSGSPIPSRYATPGYTASGFGQDNLMERLLMRLAQPGGMSKKALTQFLQQELQRQSSGQPNWMSTPTMPATQPLQEILALLMQLIQLMTSTGG